MRAGIVEVAENYVYSSAVNNYSKWQWIAAGMYLTSTFCIFVRKQYSMQNNNVGFRWDVARTLRPAWGARAMLRVDIIDGLSSQLRKAGSAPFTHQAEENEIKIFPNPSKDFFRVEVIGYVPEANLQLQLIDAFNRVILKRNFGNERQLVISSLDLPTGVYNVRVMSKQIKIDKKLIVIR